MKLLRRKRGKITALLGIMELLAVSAVVSKGFGKKNVMLVMVDDLRPVLGCYGDKKAHTPNMDELARRGVRFERAYAQMLYYFMIDFGIRSYTISCHSDGVCYQIGLGLYDFYSYWRDVAGNYTTLPQYLKSQGYDSVSFGKIFHPGASSNGSDDSPYSWSQPAFHPFTERYKDAPLCSNNASNLICPVRVAAMPNATLPDIETLQAAKKFLNKSRKKPFILAVGFQKPHIPLKYPKRYLKYHPLSKFSLPNNYKWPKNVSSVAYNPWMDLRKRNDVEKLNLKCPWQKIPSYYAKKIIQSYYAAVTYVDDLIGELLRELEILKIRNNTIIVLTSDHGWSLGEHALWAKYSNFEVALRVPLIISIPHLTFEPMKDSTFEIRDTTSVVHEPVELLDIFPTILDLAALLPVPKCPRQKMTAKMPDLCSEGMSLVPLIRVSVTSKVKLTNKSAVSQYPRAGMEPICKTSGDEPKYKDIRIMGYTIRTLRYRYTSWMTFSQLSRKPNWQEIVAEELYDHNIDSEENSNLANVAQLQNIKNHLKLMLIERLN